MALPKYFIAFLTIATAGCALLKQESEAVAGGSTFTLSASPAIQAASLLLRAGIGTQGA